MEGKGSFFSIVLLLIIAFLTLALAGLAGYVFFGLGPSRASQSTYQAEVVETPDDEDLALKKLYGEKPALFNLKSDDKTSTALPVIKVSVEFKYFKKVKGIDVEIKLNTYDGEIKELIGTYFQNMTLEDAMLPETKERASKELTEKINEMLNQSEKTKRMIIYDMVFDEWFYT